MPPDTGPENINDALRQRAERALEGQSPQRALPRGQRLEEFLHELDVTRVELQMQNEELREAQVALTALRDRYQALYDFAPVGYVTLDRDGSIVEANRRAASLLGLDLAAIEGHPLAAFVDEGDADQLHRHLMRVREGGDAEGCDLVLRTAAAPATPIHVDSSPVADEQGRPAGYRSVVIDLSDLRQAQASVRSLSAHNEAILDNASEAIVRCDQSWRIEAVNAASGRLFGCVAETLVGRDLRELVPSLSAGPAGIGAGTEPVTGRRADGTTFLLELRLGEWVESGRTKLLAIIADVTEREQRAEELRQLQKVEAVGALASGVAHDFNNVLQVVVGCLTIAQAEGTPPDRARELMGRASAAAHHGGELARSLLTFARKREVSKRPLSFDRAVVTVAPLLERLVTEQVTVSVETGAEGHYIMADPVQIEQILLNLAGNARDAMPDGGRLTIRTEVVPPAATTMREGDTSEGEPLPWIRMTVEDSGMGMDADTREHIFEPFFTTKGPGKGTGLGLATVFSTTRQLDGRLRVKSEVGQGTKFILSFPCCERPTSGRRSQYPRPGTFSGTALLVEDEPMIRMATRHHLERLGFDVVEAGQGQEALEAMAKQSRVDLLVCDLTLPVMMGKALAAELRERFPDLPVLFITANPEGENTGVGAPCTVLAKPFGIDDLAEHIERLLAPEPERDALGGPEATLLVVEDDATSGPVLAELLTASGYRVRLAASVAEALAAQDDEPISLVLSDLRLPDARGEELASELRRTRPDLPVVFMSGMDEGPAGDWPFVQKPVDYDRLLAVIEHQLDAGGRGD